MKCIYCNSEAELTSSDIITYAITGAKTVFGAYSLDSKRKTAFVTIKPKNVTIDLWRNFVSKR